MFSLNEKNVPRNAALEQISSLSTLDVVLLLEKNDLAECSRAIVKRQIDGDEFLRLTEGKLALWRSDLTRPLTRRLWKFVEELNKTPEKYLLEKKTKGKEEEGGCEEETVSEAGSWGTDFEEDVEDDDGVVNEEEDENEEEEEAREGLRGNKPDMEKGTKLRANDFRNNLMIFRENERASIKEKNLLLDNVLWNKEKKRILSREPNACTNKLGNNAINDVDRRILEREREDKREESEYANLASRENNGNKSWIRPSDIRDANERQEKTTLAEQLKEQLRLRKERKIRREPHRVHGNANLERARQSEMINMKNNNSGNAPRRSFLHDVASLSSSSSTSGTSGGGGGDKSKIISRCRGSTDRANSEKGVETDLPRPPPPLSIANLDLVANLPINRINNDDSEDEYETFDEHIIELNQRLERLGGRADSKQSLTSPRHSSLESLNRTPSIASQKEPDQEDHYSSSSGGGNGSIIKEHPPSSTEKISQPEDEYEIYESITETPEDDGYYLQPAERDKKALQKAHPPPPPPLPTLKPGAISPSISTCSVFDNKITERSPDKKSATLPHSGNTGASLTAELRAVRPLPSPPPPDGQSYMDSPWFHNITREQATALIKDRAHSNAHNGYFLLRPSTSHPNNPLALVLWFKDRVYNVPVRKRPDSRYALGSAKMNEQSFASIEEIVRFYSREDLVLHTGGVKSGATKLTETPPK